MKTLTVRIPDALASEIESEARFCDVSRSDIVRDRVTSRKPQRALSSDDIAHLIGSMKRLTPDLTANKKKYLKAGYGLKRPR